MGSPAAGKSTVAEALVASGYQRLNRDLAGGSLRGLMPRLSELLADGRDKVVLDNTCPSRGSRNEVIEAAWAHGAGVRCVWLQTSLERAQLNAVERMLAAHNRLLEPDEMRRAARSGDSSAIPPRALFDYQRQLEEPEEEEGFEAVEARPFVPRSTGGGGANSGVVVSHDIAVDDAGPRTPVAERLRHQHAAGVRIGMIAWRPASARAPVDTTPLVESALAFDCGVELRVCTHPAGPPACWCRLPLPGLGVQLRRSLELDDATTVLVGRAAAERTFPGRMGWRFITVDRWLAEPGARQ